MTSNVAWVKWDWETFECLTIYGSVAEKNKKDEHMAMVMAVLLVLAGRAVR